MWGNQKALPLGRLFGLPKRFQLWYNSVIIKLINYLFMLNKILKYGLYSLVFLLPIFFLPLTVLPTIINKQILLSLFVFLLLILWMLKIMISGKLSLAWGKLSGSVLLLFLILGISTAFSGTKAQSFWGMFFEPDTFFSLTLYILVFLLFANLISENQLKSVLISVLASSGILSFFFLIQGFWKPIFPWDFAQISGFNPVGSVQSLGIFLGGSFVILMALVGTNRSFVLPNVLTIKGRTVPKKLTQSLIVILGILLFLAIFLINNWVTWLGIILSMAIILWGMIGGLKDTVTQKDFRKFILPLFILALSLIFLIIQLPIGNIINLPGEISPTHQATLDIAMKTLQEGPKNLILGSGPATFGYQYSLHRGAGPNLTDFWQIRFDQGATAFLTFLTTSGILGSLAILLMIAIFLWQGFKGLISINQPNQHKSAVNIAIFTGGVYFLVCCFFYPINLSLIFIIFLMLGLCAAITGKKKEFLFTQSPQKAFLIMLLGIIFIVGSIIGIYNVSQKYIASLNYTQGLELINAEEPKLDEGIVKINKAAQLDPKDIYLRNLSHVFLIQINQILNNQELEQEQKQALFQQAVSNAELFATAAVQVNTANSQNWLKLGNVYENLAIFGIEGTVELAILNYQKAGELDPQNPQIPLNIGRIYKTEVERLKVQLAVLEASEDVEQAEIEQSKEAYRQNFDLSMEYFNKSAELKPNFSAAYYLIAQNYETNDEKEKALENYQIVLQLEPENEEIQQKVEELNK